MKTYRFYYQTIVQFRVPVMAHNFKLRCLPVSCASQTIQDVSFHLYPSDTRVMHDTDGFGNAIQYGRINSPHSLFTFTCAGTAITADYRLPQATISYYYYIPTPLTTLSSEMEEWISSCGPDKLSSDSIRSWAARATRLVYNKMEYESGHTNSQTTAVESFAMGKGVCQDFAHILIALCRHFGIGARYVNGFILGEGATHAWVEIFDGSAWYGYDPTNDKEIECGYIKVAHGRDANDCAMNRGSFIGQATQDMQIIVIVEEI